MFRHVCPEHPDPAVFQLLDILPSLPPFLSTLVSCFFMPYSSLATRLVLNPQPQSGGTISQSPAVFCPTRTNLAFQVGCQVPRAGSWHSCSHSTPVEPLPCAGTAAGPGITK